MKVDEYLNNSKNRLERYYTLSENLTYADTSFELDAEFAAHEDHTVLFKDNVMDYSNSIEHILYKYEPFLDYEIVQKYLRKVPLLSAEITKPSFYHKTTVIKLILVTDKFDPQEDEEPVRKLVSRFHFSKAHKFYLHGWTEGYFFIENLKDTTEMKSRGMKKISYLTIA